MAHTPPPGGIWMLCQDSPDFQAAREHETRAEASFEEAMKSADGTFATKENVATMWPFLMNSLRGLGLPSDFNLLSGAPADVALAANCLHTLVQQRQSDRDTIDVLQGEAGKLRSNASAAERDSQRARDSLDTKITEIGTLEIKIRNLERSHRGELQQLQKDRDALERKVRSIEQQQGNMQREVRRKDLEVEELQRKLRGMLTSSRNLKQAAGGAVFVGSSGSGAASELPQGGSFRGRAGKEEAAEADVRLQRMLENAEVRNTALLAENDSLRGSLKDAQQDVVRLVRRAEALGFGPALTSSQSGALGESDASSDMAYIASTLQVVQDRCRQMVSDESMEDVQCCGPTCQSLKLATEVRSARALLKDQADALSKAMVSLRIANVARDQTQKANSSQATKILGLERRVSELTAEAMLHGESQDRMQQAEGEATLLRKQLELMKCAVTGAGAHEAAQKMELMLTSTTNDTFNQLEQVQEELAHAKGHLARLQRSHDTSSNKDRDENQSLATAMPAGATAEVAVTPQEFLQAFGDQTSCVIQAVSPFSVEGKGVMKSPTPPQQEPQEEKQGKRQRWAVNPIAVPELSLPELLRQLSPCPSPSM